MEIRGARRNCILLFNYARLLITPNSFVTFVVAGTITIFFGAPQLFLILSAHRAHGDMLQLLMETKKGPLLANTFTEQW